MCNYITSLLISFSAHSSRNAPCSCSRDSGAGATPQPPALPSTAHASATSARSRGLSGAGAECTSASPAANTSAASGLMGRCGGFIGLLVSE